MALLSQRTRSLHWPGAPARPRFPRFRTWTIGSTACAWGILIEMSASAYDESGFLTIQDSRITPKTF